MSKCPRGLTALAVLNFALAVLSAVSYASLLALLGEDGATRRDPTANGAVYAVMVTGLASSALLVLAGVGYLKRHRILGLVAGNAYALLALASSVVVVAALPDGFGLATVIGFVYPPLTLALLNLRFRAQFA